MLALELLLLLALIPILRLIALLLPHTLIPHTQAPRLTHVPHPPNDRERNGRRAIIPC